MADHRFTAQGGPHIRRGAGVDIPATGGISDARQQRRAGERDRGKTEDAAPLGRARELRHKLVRDIASAAALGNTGERLKLEGRLQAVDAVLAKLGAGDEV